MEMEWAVAPPKALIFFHGLSGKSKKNLEKAGAFPYSDVPSFAFGIAVYRQESLEIFCCRPWLLCTHF
jgi:hypothetical protein